MRHSDWASVPTGGLGLKVSYGPLNVPYKNRKAMAQYPVPSLPKLAAACNIVILDDFHIRFYGVIFDKMGLHDRWMEWKDLFKEMAQVRPPMVFASKYPLHGVSRIEVYDLRSSK
jgi:hypothetical protein